jgi:signal transduction histidine kinase
MMGEHTNKSDNDIKRLMSAMVYAFNYEELTQNIVTVFAKLFDAELCSIWRRLEREGEDRLELSASIGIQRKPGDIVPTYTLNWNAKSNNEIEGVTAWIAIRKQVCLANSYFELTQDPSTPWFGSHRGKWDSYQFSDEQGKKFMNLLGLPIIFAGDRDAKELIGVIKVESTQDRSIFFEHDRQLALRLLPFVAIALQSMSVREKREQHRQHVLRDLTSVLLRQESTTFYQEVVNKTAELLRADICSLWLADEENKKLTLGANYGVTKKGKIPEYKLDWNDDDENLGGLTPWVLTRKRSFFGEKHEDLTSHPAWRGIWDRDQWQGKAQNLFGCLYAVPLINVDDKPFGVLKIENRSGKPKFDAVDRATFDLIADFVALAIEFNSRLRSDIVYDFFHLLRQPVSTTVMAFRDLRNELNTTSPRKERIKSRIEMLARNLETLSVWITNVYGLATIKNDVPKEESSEVPVERLLSGAIETMKNMFPEFNCDLANVQNLVLKVTPLQQKKIDAIFYNILDNSFRYSEEPRRISIETSLKKEFISLTIRDNGKGIDPDDLLRVCKPYVTIGSTETGSERMGLGLSTVDKLLKEFGWQYHISSQVNEGTSFIISIPKEVMP